MRIAAVNFRFKGHLRAATLYKGRTLRSVKCGNLEHDVVVGLARKSNTTHASNGRHHHM